MGKNEIDVGNAMRLLGRGGRHPVAARRHRNVLATRYALDVRDEWEWSAQSQVDDGIAGLAFADAPMMIVSDLGEQVLAAGEIAFLHPHRETKVEALALGLGVCVCVPWDALREIEDGVQPPEQIIASTPLTAGLVAFVTSLLTQQQPPTLYTDYLVERIVIEMTFGVLLESVPRTIVGARDARPINRARTLMLLRRAEPEFGIAALAQELHMSTRHVQRVFAAEGSSPAEELRRMRLDLARELLGDPDYDPLSIGEVAAHAGFKTAAAMRRAFAARDMPLPGRSRRDRVAAS